MVYGSFPGVLEILGQDSHCGNIEQQLVRVAIHTHFHVRLEIRAELHQVQGWHFKPAGGIPQLYKYSAQCSLSIYKSISL